MQVLRQTTKKFTEEKINELVAKLKKITSNNFQKIDYILHQKAMKNLSTTKQNKKRENEMEKLKGYSIYKISANQPSELIEITDNKKTSINLLKHKPTL